MTEKLLTERESALLARRADIIEMGNGVLLTDRARAKLIRDADNMLVADYANRLSRLAAELRAVRADNERKDAVERAARAFVASTSVFRQRRECRREFEALAVALLNALAHRGGVASAVPGEGA